MPTPQDIEPKVGDVLTISVAPGRARYAYVIRARSDAPDFRRCERCKETFSYGPIARDCISDELICTYDCAKG